MKKLWIVFLFFPSLVEAQIDTVFVKRSDIVRGVDGVLHTFSAPARWKGKDWLVVGGIAATTAAITLLDDPIYNFWQGRECEIMDGFERIGYHYGKPYSAVAVTGGFYLAGVILKNEWAKETGLMLATSLTTSTVLQTLFKNVLGRARPVTGMDNYDMQPFSKASEYHSLPSGHATVAFTMSLVLARQVKYVPVKIFFYSLAGVTAMSRMYTDAHWISDVAFGGTIAWFCVDAAMKRLQANRFRPVARQHKFSVKLYPYPGGLSLRGTW
jgi:membrane-associated phospholipid phosphatase